MQRSGWIVQAWGSAGRVTVGPQGSSPPQFTAPSPPATGESFSLFKAKPILVFGVLFLLVPTDPGFITLRLHRCLLLKVPMP